MLIYVVGLAIGFVAYKIYELFRVPDHLKEYPAIPFSSSLISIFRKESYVDRHNRLIQPVLSMTGEARSFGQGKWELELSNATRINEILTNTDKFLKRDKDVTNQHSLFQITMGIDSILLTDGDEWKHHRRVINPAFKKSWSTEVFGECANELVQLIRKGGGNPQNIRKLFQWLTLDVLGKGLFSYDFEATKKGEESESLNVYNDVIKGISNPIFFLFPSLEAWVPSRLALHKKGLEFRGLLRKIVRERTSELSSDKDDLLSLIAKSSLEKTENSLTEDQVINDLAIFFLAGHDTTANTLTTTLYYLASHPQIQEKARKEVNLVLRNEKRTPSSDEIKKLEYIDCIIKESMRIITTVPRLRRFCKQDTSLSDGFVVPGNTFVNLQMWSLHHDPEIYPDPDSFKPERFLDPHSPASTQWMAFGGGARMCVGKNFSLIEQRVVLATLLQQFIFTSHPTAGKLAYPNLNSTGLIRPIDLEVSFHPID